MKPTLLILAAGMGSRYAGLKQLDGFGPNGETIMDYSIHDALAAGFGKVVFVIRRDFEDAFRKAVVARYERRVAVACVFQELAELPAGFAVPPGRTKPWGTAHAIWCARAAIAEPFASINADDYYGKRAFRLVADHLAGGARAGGLPELCMVGYPVAATLSEHAPVTRAVCQVDGEGFLEGLVERMKVERSGDGARYSDETGVHELPADAVVSMNLWGFTPAVFAGLERHLSEFLAAQPPRGPNDRECLIPVAVGEWLRERVARVRVLRTSDRWFGVTHPQDKPAVMDALRAMVERGDYPSPIWTD